jgi:adenine-specific DNA-methyltransferase
MIKYLGSKRRLVGALGEMATAAGARTALDLFTGTTRVAQGFKARGVEVTAVDTARYSEVLARCYIEADAERVDAVGLADALRDLQARPSAAGYVTETFCRTARYFHPDNGERIDAIRDAIEEDYAATELYPILLTSLLEAADRVDSTTGVQMAFLKQWARRALKPLVLRPPGLLAGGGRAVRDDARAAARSLGPFDLAYLDPPYNQHRYFTNYHVWETLVAWDAPAHYGVACKRIDARDPATRSPFNRRSEMRAALAECIAAVDAGLVIVSYNNEAWLSLDDLRELSRCRGHVAVVAFDSKRYVGAQIGIHNPRGEKVGTVSHLRNLEYLVVCGDKAAVRRAVTAARAVAA